MKGDIIIKTDNDFGYQAIYDGYQLIPYFYWLEPMYLNESFDIIRNKVPFNYWDIFEWVTIDLDVGSMYRKY